MWGIINKIEDAQSVVRHAKDDKPTTRTTDLISVLNYYMINDAFTDLINQ
jgi:hypothetical protein